MQTCVSHCKRKGAPQSMCIRELGIVNSRCRELGLDDFVVVVLRLENESHLWIGQRPPLKIGCPDGKLWLAVRGSGSGLLLWV